MSAENPWKFGTLDAPGISGNFGVMPFNGESDGSIAKHAEIVAIVRIFRDPLAGKN